MKVLLTGAAGQLGQALISSCPSDLELIATSRDELDLSEAAACRAAVERHRPDWVLNAGAYTAVDKAEAEPDLANAVNGEAPRAFAEAIQQVGGRLLQLSTDFVFNGHQGSPYRVEQPRDPLGIYGASKARGEEAIETVIEALVDKDGKIAEESADLLYHLLVLWADKGVRPEDVWSVLVDRFGISGIDEKNVRGKD